LLTQALEGDMVALVGAPDRGAGIDRPGGRFAQVAGCRLQDGWQAAPGRERDWRERPLRRLSRVGHDPARQGEGNHDAE